MVPSGILLGNKQLHWWCSYDGCRGCAHLLFSRQCHGAMAWPPSLCSGSCKLLNNYWVELGFEAPTSCRNSALKFHYLQPSMKKEQPHRSKNALQWNTPEYNKKRLIWKWILLKFSLVQFHSLPPLPRHHWLWVGSPMPPIWPGWLCKGLKYEATSQAKKTQV